MTPVSVNLHARRCGLRREPASKRYRRINDRRDNRHSPYEAAPHPAWHASVGQRQMRAVLVITRVRLTDSGKRQLSPWKPAMVFWSGRNQNNLRLRLASASRRRLGAYPVGVAVQIEFEHVARIIAPAFRCEDARDDTRAVGRMNRTAGTVRRSGTPGGCYCGGARASWVPRAGWPARSPQLSRCDGVPG